MFNRDGPEAFYMACRQRIEFNDCPNGSAGGFHVGAISVNAFYHEADAKASHMTVEAMVDGRVIAGVKIRIGTGHWTCFPEDDDNMMLYLALA